MDDAQHTDSLGSRGGVPANMAGETGKGPHGTKDSPDPGNLVVRIDRREGEGRMGAGDQINPGRLRDVLSLIGGDQIIFDRPASLTRRSYEIIVRYIELMEAAWVTEEAVPESDEETIPDEDEPAQAKITNEKPVSLAPLGFEEAVGALLETGPMPREEDEPKPKRKYRRPISLAHLSPEEAIKRAMAVPYKAKGKRKKEEDAGLKAGAMPREAAQESVVAPDKSGEIIWEKSGVIKRQADDERIAGDQWEEDDEEGSEDHESEGYDYEGKADETDEADGLY